MSDINIGLTENARQNIAHSLSRLLADSYTLYLKTQNFHWNVTGPRFQEVHALTEMHYTDLAAAIDAIAERIRALGEYAPGSYSSYQKLATLKEEAGVPAANEMLAVLAKDHEQIARNIREALPAAQEATDESSASLLSDRLSVHEKTAWMLRSMV
ncbi:DNA starvation/stationary phase protection protein [Hahella sp. KA22]|uniref:Dps family protein n=1 Tax=Hahella sp. KA22 TaxID=1628392 RepID=UPI000FDD4736|nr:Dps family protein [Hahella sp. KA22]AZZ94825.1 DNA starvation/stationary phase protection protein [Hahella sp. KA22]QAY58199.1 DNA starvation/stationary phase protection protein [Hahella sp. KA22]